MSYTDRGSLLLHCEHQVKNHSEGNTQHINRLPEPGVRRAELQQRQEAPARAAPTSRGCRLHGSSTSQVVPRFLHPEPSTAAAAPSSLVRSSLVSGLLGSCRPACWGMPTSSTYCGHSSSPASGGTREGALRGLSCTARPA